MIRFQRAATTFSLVAELSHVFCCGLPIVVAVMSAGSQIGLGGSFLTFHGMIHDIEVPILITSGVLLAVGFGLHFVSHLIDCRREVCAHSDCEPKKFQVGWIFTIALMLYAANVTFYVMSGHGVELARFN